MSEQATPRPRARRAFVALLVLVVLAAGGYAAWRLLAPPTLPAGVLAVSGRIEGDDSAVAAKTTGRIREIPVREGDTVTAGEVIAVLDDEQIARARGAGARRRCAQAEARARGGPRPDRRAQRAAAAERAAGPGARRRGGPRQPGRSRVARGRGAARAGRGRVHAGEVGQGSVHAARRRAPSPSRRPGVPPTTEQQAAVVAAARKRRSRRRAARSTTAKANLANPAIRAAQAAAIQRPDPASSRPRSSAAQADASARAQLSRRREPTASDLTVDRAVRRHRRHARGRAGRGGDGGHADRHARRSVARVPARVRPGGRNRRVQVGQPARVYLDSAPTTPIEAIGLAHRSARRRSRRRTPTSARTASSRWSASSCSCRAPSGFAKPGMPADGEILVRGRRDSGQRRQSPRPRRPRRRRRSASPTSGSATATVEAVRGIAFDVARGRDLRPHRSRRRRQDVDVPDSRRRDGATVGRGRGLRPPGARGARRDRLSHADLQPVSRPHRRREPPLPRRSAARAARRDRSSAAMRYLRDVRHGPLHRPAGRPAERRDEAEARARLRARARAARPAARRADDRRRSGVAPRVLGRAGAPGRRRASRSSSPRRTSTRPSAAIASR